jgi:cysteinyl-tRNA synthetase
MSLQVFNSYSGKKEAFVPQDPKRVTMYVCGPTVYNRVHIGNARPAVVFDTLYRLLQSQYEQVIYARNITDIDDKIIKTARDNGETIGSLTSRFTAAYVEDMHALNNLPPTMAPKATEHVVEMIAMIETLLATGNAYESAGHILFDVRSMADYGALSKRSLEDMLAGARVEVADYKRYAGDFVLWKPSSEIEPGWESPWGFGRPGWHLECSAMAEKHLGNTIDIHGGGIDLRFPHHENEIAQSCCAHGGEPFAQYWMHNAFINIDGEKMSKSLGNFRLVNDLLDHYSGEVIRFAILSAHYRSELNFSVDVLDGARNTLDKLYGYLQGLEEVVVDSDVDINGCDIFKALLDDLNTPIAIRELHVLGKQLKAASGAQQAQLKSLFVKAAGFMGLLQQSPAQWFYVAAAEGALSDQAVQALVDNMVSARAEQDYALADQYREQLSEQGITLTREGWKRS